MTEPTWPNWLLPSALPAEQPRGQVHSKWDQKPVKPAKAPPPTAAKSSAAASLPIAEPDTAQQPKRRRWWNDPQATTMIKPTELVRPADLEPELRLHIPTMAERCGLRVGRCVRVVVGTPERNETVGVCITDRTMHGYSGRIYEPSGRYRRGTEVLFDAGHIVAIGGPIKSDASR
jgi:hypothetical protein